MTSEEFTIDLVNRLGQFRQLLSKDQPILTILLLRLVQTLDYLRADLSREVMHRACREAGVLGQEMPIVTQLLESLNDSTEGNPFDTFDESIDERLSEDDDDVEPDDDEN